VRYWKERLGWLGAVVDGLVIEGASRFEDFLVATAEDIGMLGLEGF